MFPQTRRQHFELYFSCHKERLAPCGSIYIIITFMITPYVPKMYNDQTIFCIVFCIASILYTFHWENWVKPPNSFSFSNNSYNKIYTRQIFCFKFYWISNYYCHAIQFVLFFCLQIESSHIGIPRNHQTNQWILRQETFISDVCQISF